MNKFEITLEVVNELIEENKELLNSKHFSVRYSAETTLRSLKEVKELVEWKIEDR